MAAVTTPYPQFLLFGDSLIEYASHLLEGFSLVAALQSRYMRRLDVINRGLSGYNTAQALEVLPKIIPPTTATRLEYFLVLFGANDACLPEAPTLQHVPLHLFKKNLKALITHPLVVAQRPRIILVTPPPIDEAQQEIWAAKNGFSLARRAAVTAEYAEAVRELGIEVGGELVVLDLWSAVMEEAILETPDYKPGGPLLGAREAGRSEVLANLMPDGLHFGSLGYKVFLRELKAVVENKWPDTPGSDSFVFPEWRKAPKAGESTLEG